MLNIGVTPKPEWVEIEGYEIGGGKHNFRINALPMPADVVALFESGKQFTPQDEMSHAQVAELIEGWESATGALTDLGTKEVLECTPENLLAFMREIPEGYTLLNGALIKSYTDRVLKNLRASSVSNGTAGRVSVKVAKRTKKPRRK